MVEYKTYYYSETGPKILKQKGKAIKSESYKTPSNNMATRKKILIKKPSVIPSNLKDLPVGKVIEDVVILFLYVFNLKKQLLVLKNLVLFLVILKTFLLVKSLRMLSLLLLRKKLRILSNLVSLV